MCKLATACVARGVSSAKGVGTGPLKEDNRKGVSFKGGTPDTRITEISIRE